MTSEGCHGLQAGTPTRQASIADGNQRYGRQLVVIDRWFPSSKTCSTCGHVLAELELSIRHWTCPSCRTRHDRDVNAAKNILAAGLAVTACGAGVRHSGGLRVQPVMKQELPGASPGIPVLQLQDEGVVKRPKCYRRAPTSAGKDAPG
jgi:Putative transposase DNA-binding domain